MNVYRVIAVKAKRPFERKHTCFHYKVLANDIEEAQDVIRDRFPDADLIQARLQFTESTGPLVFDNGITMLEPAILRRLKGESEPPKPPAREPKPSKRPLTDRQQSVLRSTANTGYPDGGWLYDTHSGTVRILESLRMRCLVEKSGHKYTVTDEGRKWL